MIDLKQLIAKGVNDHKLSQAEIVCLLEDPAPATALFEAADQVRRQYVGDCVHLRGLIEFSNICRQSCHYCGLRCDNEELRRYRLQPDEILKLAEQARDFGYKTVVLQSGEDAWYTAAIIADIVVRIKALGLAITLSIGERSREEYALWRQAGADRYLLRIETTDKKLYEQLDPGMSWDNRLRCLRDLRELGYELGTGSLIGLPGQSLASIAQDLLFFQELDADMIGVGPFIPHPVTPLAQTAGGTFDLACRAVSICRLLQPTSNIPATTAMETLDPNGRMLALQRGANVVMPNVTETEYRPLYQLYPGKICLDDSPAHCRGCITGKIHSIGRIVAQDAGFRKK